MIRREFPGSSNTIRHTRSKITMSLPKTQNVIRSPASESQAIPRTTNIDEDEMQRCGLEHINTAYTDDYNNNTIFNVSWSAYFANL